MELKCPKCNSNMIKGTRADNTHGGFAVESWVPDGYFENDQKTKSDFLAKKYKSMGKYVSSYACSKCGYIESYIQN